MWHRGLQMLTSTWFAVEDANAWELHSASSYIEAQSHGRTDDTDFFPVCFVFVHQTNSLSLSLSLSL